MAPHLDRDELVSRYFNSISRAGIQERYQVDIYVGDVENAPPANEAHFILEKDGFWMVEDWSRGVLQKKAIFINLSSALDYSFNSLSMRPEFRKAARDLGFNPPKYEFLELIEALSIAFAGANVRFSERKLTNHLIASKDELLLKLHYSEESRLATAKIYKFDRLDSEFDNLSDALTYFYWSFMPLKLAV